MAKVLLPGAVKRHVYSIKVTIDDEGTEVKNRDQPEEHQIVGYIRMVPPGEKDKYVSVQTHVQSRRKGKKKKALTDVTTYKSNPTECTRMYLDKLEGLEDYKVDNGQSLADFPEKNKVINAIIEETHLVACALYKDPDEDDDEDEI